ncbi:MAG: RnfABCDGE type electron transport complex subunit G [Breznakibacter sp.]
MAKTESTLKNMLLTLLVITLISGASLGGMYKLTKAPIEASKQAKQQNAISQVTPEFDNDPAAEAIEATTEDGSVIKLFPAKKSGELVGMAVESVTNKGFGGEVRIMIGFAPDGSIINYQVLEHKETPGLGTKMGEWFRTDKGAQSILGKNPGSNNLTVVKDGGEVDAITAATISSRAFLDAVDVAYKAFQAHMPANDVMTNDSTTIMEGGIQ